MEVDKEADTVLRVLFMGKTPKFYVFLVESSLMDYLLAYSASATWMQVLIDA